MGRIVVILHAVVRVLRHDRHRTVQATTTGQAVLDHLRWRAGTTALVVVEVVRVVGTSSSEVMGRQRRESASITMGRRALHRASADTARDVGTASRTVPEVLDGGSGGMVRHLTRAERPVRARGAVATVSLDARCRVAVVVANCIGLPVDRVVHAVLEVTRRPELPLADTRPDEER